MGRYNTPLSTPRLGFGMDLWAGLALLKWCSPHSTYIALTRTGAGLNIGTKVHHKFACAILQSCTPNLLLKLVSPLLA